METKLIATSATVGARAAVPLAHRTRRLDPPPERVIVVGGGLSGLVTAYELGRHGVPALVLEGADRLGGRVRTVTFPDGSRAEALLEELWEANPAFALAGELGLGLAERATYSRAIVGGRLLATRGGDAHDLADAFAPADRPDLWRWFATARAADDASATDAGVRRALVACSLAEYVASLHLPPDVAEWIRLTVEVEAAASWRHLTAADGLAELRPYLADPRTGRGERNGQIAGGNERLVERLCGELTLASLRTGCRVNRVVDRGVAGGVDVSYRDRNGRHRTERGTHVVLALPVWELAHIALDPVLPPAPQRAIATMRTGSYVKVLHRLRPGAAHAWAAPGTAVSTLLTDGPAGCVYVSDDGVLTSLVHGAEARRLARRSEAEIVATSLAALDALAASDVTGGPARAVFPGLSAHVAASRAVVVRRAVAHWPHALGRSRFDALASSLRRPHGRVLLAGDSVDSSHSDGAMTAAHRAAAQILARMGAMA